jgi:ubiquinone/menaquinone biosynthesis C-methylase UbiE
LHLLGLHAIVSANTARSKNNDMAKIGNFTQPDASPTYFIEFLEFLDNHIDIKSFRAEAAKRLHLAPGHKVLDLGCGIGGATFPLAEVVGANGLAAGVDISSAMIEVARRRANDRAKIEFRVGEATAIPYPDKFFDVARSERVFLYLPDRLAAIQEMKRVVKPGGLVCLIDTDLDSTAVYSKNLGLTRKMTSIVAGTMPNPNSARDLPALAKQAGLKSVKTETFSITTPHEFFVRVMASLLAKAVEDGIVPSAEVEDWLDEQAALHASGDFFQMWFFVMVCGTA